MAFKDIHKLKKISVIEKETIVVPYLVVGKDVFAISLYNSLKEIHGAEKVRLLSQDNILKSDLFPKGPSTIRGKANQEVFSKLYPEVEIKNGDRGALFYKDMSWKNFEGRSKSEMLKYDEEFFTKPRFDVEVEQVFKNFSAENENKEFLEQMNREAYHVRLKSIQRSVSDEGKGEGFIVECINGTEFHCEYLYFGLSPFHYLQLYTNKNELSAPFIEFCESTKTASALFVKFVFENKPLSDLKETLFIPLSYTHDWGHFVGEFKDVGGSQEIELMYFLEDHLMSEEDISRVIRLLKKSMEKIFNNYSSIKSHEFIVLEQELGCLKIDDSLYFKAREEKKVGLANLFFIGINAPISKEQCSEAMCEYSTELLSGLSRGLLVEAIIKQSSTKELC